MFDRLVAKVQAVVARVIAWQINENHERAAMRLLESLHIGAVELTVWAEDIREKPGRHALRLVAHH